jgi:ELWxxDGT repeat protein
MGARLIRDLNPAGSSSPESIISIDGLLFFTADLGSGSTTEAPTGEDTPDPDNDSSEDGNENNREGSNNSNFNDNTTGDTDQAIGQGPALMKSDGTSEGTKVLKEFQSINNLVEVNGELYFIADDGTGNRLWRSDGTARGTVLVKDLYPGADPNFPQDLFEIDGVLFYAAIDGTGDDGKYFMSMDMRSGGEKETVLAHASLEISSPTKSLQTRKSVPKKSRKSPWTRMGSQLSSLRPPL